MIINRVWTSTMIHVYSPRRNFVFTANVDAIFLLLLRYLQYPRLDHLGSPYPVQSRYWNCYLLIPVIFHPRDLVTCCNIGCISLSGPRVSSITRMSKSRSWSIRLNILHWKPERHLFSYRITEWRLMLSKLPLEIVIKYDLEV
jgi:hypothetical protein